MESFQLGADGWPGQVGLKFRNPDQPEKLEKKGQNTGIRKFRKKVKQENGNKLIVFDKDRWLMADLCEKS